MNISDSTQFNLIREMFETVSVVRNFDRSVISGFPIASDAVLLSGEGSSRIFPAKHLIRKALTNGFPQQIITENATQSREYNLDGFHVFVASNSGKTAEGIRLIRALRDNGKPAEVTGIVAKWTARHFRYFTMNGSLTRSDMASASSSRSMPRERPSSISLRNHSSLKASELQNWRMKRANSRERDQT